jgi:phospholipid/cholesterol/gamma-HCH transport system substrate-binding protein
VTGVEYGTRVMFEGFPIGQVETITPIQEEGRVVFRVDMSVIEGWKIPADSIAAITSSGLLAAVTIEIKAGKSAEMLKPGARIAGKEATNVMAAVSNIANELTDLTENNVKPLIDNLNNTVLTFGRLLDTEGAGLIRDVRGLADTMSAQVPEIVDNLDKFSVKLNTSADRLNSILAPKNIDRIDSVFANLDEATKNMTTLTRDFERTRGNADKLLQNLDSLLQDNRLDIDRSVVELRYSVESVSRHIDAINQNLEGAARNMYEFSRQIRQNPGLLLGGKPPVDEAPQ